MKSESKIAHMLYKLGPDWLMLGHMTQLFAGIGCNGSPCRLAASFKRQREIFAPLLDEERIKDGEMK